MAGSNVSGRSRSLGNPTSIESAPATFADAAAWTQPIQHQTRYPGDASGEVTPVPIPNTEVKLSSAEDTGGHPSGK